ncbi:unnamed protein product [Closterium sp. NIES-64]|nr:unnamed protein product [Closterium sp. NIES-64]
MPRSPVRSRRSYEGGSAKRAAVEPGAVADQPDPPEGLEEDSDGGESVMSVIDDGFNTLVELYIFFREADLSRREHIAGFVTKPRADEDDTDTVRHYSTPDTGKWLEEAQRQHARLEKWQTGGMAGPNQFVQHLGSAPLAGAGPRTGWGSAVPARVGVADREDTHFPAVHGGDIRAPTLGAQRLRWFYVTDATGKVVKAFPCLGDFPESSRSTATLQQGSHRPCSSCYIKETHFAELSRKSVVRTVELQRRVVEAIQSADDNKAAEKIQKRWSTHPVHNFAETTWGNVFLACAADLLHVLDGGMLPRMGKCFMIGRSKPERREFERRRKEQKKDMRACVVRIPGRTTWFSTGANYAAFEHRGMMQVMPLLIANNMEKSKPPAKAKREREVAAFVAYASFHKALVGVTKHTEKSLDDVREMAVQMVAAIKAAFPDQTSDWNILKVHQIVHLIDGIPLRGMPNETSTNLWEHTHKGTVKVPVRDSNWHDIPRRIVEEEVQREIAREVAAEAGGNRQYVTALREAVRRMKPVLTKTSKRAHVDEDLDAVLWAYREAHGSDMDVLAGCMVAVGIPTTTIEVGNDVAVAIPRTRGGELVPKGTFVKASPSERWFSDIAVFRSDEEEWYARCLCIFRAEGADGEMGRHVYVQYYEEEGTCPMTTCLQLSPGRVRTRYAVVDVECIQRVVHVCKSYVNKRVMLLNKFLLTE